MKKWIEMFHCHLPPGSQEQICDVFWALAWLPKKKKLNFFFPKQRKGQIFMHNYNTYIRIGVCVRVHMYLYALQCCIHTCNTPQNKYYISIKEKIYVGTLFSTGGCYSWNYHSSKSSTNTPPTIRHGCIWIAFADASFSSLFEMIWLILFTARHDRARIC